MGQAPLQICPPQLVSVPAPEASAPEWWPGTGRLLTPTVLPAASSLPGPSPQSMFFILPPSFHKNAKHTALLLHLSRAVPSYNAAPFFLLSQRFPQTGFLHSIGADAAEIPLHEGAALTAAKWYHL